VQEARLWPFRTPTEGVGDGSFGNPRTPHLLFSEISNGVARDEAPATPFNILLAMIERDPWLVFDVFNDQHRTPLA
jgi:hypothetical protein